MTHPIDGESLGRLLKALETDLEDANLPYRVHGDQVSIVDVDTRPAGTQQLNIALPLATEIKATILHPWRNADLDDDEVAEQAMLITEVIEDIAAVQDDLVPALLEMRAVAKRQLESLAKDGAHVTYLGLDIAPLQTGSQGEPDLQLTFLQLGNDLQIDWVTRFVTNSEDVRSLIQELGVKQKALGSLKDELEDAGADGLIDPVVLSALLQLEIDPFDHMARVRDFSLAGTIENEFGPIRTGFLDGLYTGHVPLAPGVTWRCGSLHFEKVPEHVMGSLEGKRVVDAVSSSLIPDDAVFGIMTARPGKAQVFPVSSGRMLFKVEDEKTWLESADKSDVMA